MESEKKYFGGWWIWVLFLSIITGAVLTGLNYAGIIGTTVVERVVFENSYQKHAADKTAISTYQAQLAVLRGRLGNPNLDAGARAEINAQIDSITILMASKGE